MLTKIQEWILIAEFLALKAAAGVSNSLEEQIVPKIGRGVEYARKFIIKLECKFYFQYQDHSFNCLLLPLRQKL